MQDQSQSFATEFKYCIIMQYGKTSAGNLRVPANYRPKVFARKQSPRKDKKVVVQKFRRRKIKCHYFVKKILLPPKTARMSADKKFFFFFDHFLLYFSLFHFFLRNKKSFRQGMTPFLEKEVAYFSGLFNNSKKKGKNLTVTRLI